MKKLILGLAAAMSLGAVSCGNPCDKLAKAVCDKSKDAKICDSFKAKAKNMDKNVCKEQMKNVDNIVTGLQMAEKLKEGFKNIGSGLLNKAGDALNKALGGKAPEAPAPAAPAPVAPAPAAPAPMAPAK